MVAALVSSTAMQQGLPAYRAPELQCSAEPSAASDVFSLGVLFYNVLASAGSQHGSPLPHPFCQDSSCHLQQAAINRESVIMDLSGLPLEDAEAANLISAMLQRDPAARPTASEVLDHPFFFTAAQRTQHMKSWLLLLCNTTIPPNDR
jgi:serine/threonine-protein kinase/endoribonuclease IRE1